ncbi:uncharacterized protein LOC62_03G004129 [Vanrija pseudolonga]|uniref:Uncharacterized protein n=1 Tax=Vanrija pseudolonga TaxID=143232 RepID=A0AAF0YBI7_9TREE|nr:hypothetical protein LOC62_03G004129 [Vanrija pseudolonga]WOO80604.1 hypothetical protein LOC62_03G004129 [Vanrija pseudolonga]
MPREPLTSTRHSSIPTSRTKNNYSHTRHHTMNPDRRDYGVGHTSSGIAGTGVGAGAIAEAKNDMDPNVNTRNTGQGMMGHETMGHNTMGHNTMGHNTMGHNNMGHNAMGHGTMDNTMGTNTIGHTSSGLAGTGIGAGAMAKIKNALDPNVNTDSTGHHQTGHRHDHTMGHSTMGTNTVGTNAMGHTSSGLAGTGVGAGAMASAKNAMDPNVNTHSSGHHHTGHHHDHSMGHNTMSHGHHTSTSLAGTGVGASTMAGMKDTMDPNVHSRHTNVSGGTHTSGPHTSTGMAGTGVGAGLAADAKNKMDPAVDSRPTGDKIAGSPPRTHAAVPRSPTSPTGAASASGHSGIKDPEHAEAALAMLESGDAPFSAAMGRDPITGAKLPKGSTLAKVADAVAGDGDVNAAAAHARTSLDRSSMSDTMSPTTAATLDAGSVAAERRHVGDSADVRALGDKMEAARLDDRDTNRHHVGRDAAVVGGAAALGAGAMHHHNKNERAGDHTAGPHTSTGLAGTGLGASTAADMKNKMDPRVDATTGHTTSGMLGSDRHTMTGDNREHHYGRDAALVGGAAAVGAGAMHHHNKNERAGDHTAGPHTSTGLAGTGLGASTAADVKNKMDPRVDASTGHSTSGTLGSDRHTMTGDHHGHHVERDAAMAGGAGALAAGAMHHHDKREREMEHAAAPLSTGARADVTTSMTPSDAAYRRDHDRLDHSGRDAAVGGGAAALTAGALHHHDRNRLVDDSMRNDSMTAVAGSPAGEHTNPMGSNLTSSNPMASNVHTGDHTAGPHTSTGIAGTGLGASTAADMKNTMDPKVDSTTGHATRERGLDTGAFGMMANKEQPADPNRIPPHTSTGLFGTGVGAEAIAKVKNALDPKVDMSLSPDNTNDATMRNRGPGHIAMPADNDAHPNLFAKADESRVVDNTRMPGAYTDRVNEASKNSANVVVTPVEEHSRIF